MAVAKRNSKTSLSFSLKIRGDWHSLGLLIGGLIGLAQVQSTPHTPTPDAPGTTYIAGVSSRTLHFDDNSTVILNKGSAVEVRYTPEGREVELPQGEAMFLVAPDPTRPFRAHAGDTSVDVLGTAFSISRQPGHTDIFVTQGRVAVNHGQSPARQLDAGASLRIQPNRVSTLDLTADERDARLSWANPLAEDKSRTLSEIVRTLNEFNDIQLVIDDDKLARVGITGPIPTLTQPRAFARMLHDLLNVETLPGGGEDGSKVILLRRAKHH